MSTHKWSTPTAATTYLSTELNALADSGNKLGAAIDLTATLEQYLDLDIFLSTFTPVANGYINIYLLASVDGTNYPDGADGTDPSPDYIVASAGVLSGASVTRRVWIPRIIIPPFPFKLLFENKTGAALAATLNTVKYREYFERDV
jgi:hypothetical protein